MTSIISHVFFYGLFMDPAVLEEHGVSGKGSRSGLVRDWGLRIGQRATMVPAAGEVVYGMIMTMDLRSLHRLYAGPSIRMYHPAAVLVEGPTLEDRAVPALAYVIPEQHGPSNRSAEYVGRLRALAERLGFPRSYAESIA